MICQAGLPWHQARSQAMACAQDTILAAFDPAEIRPKGDVAGMMRKLTQAQIRIAIVTSDDRHMTETTLELLGVVDMIELIICGDDPLPNKPSPEALWQISAQLGIETKRIMVVGDTLSDMEFARNAGAAFRIGIAPAARGINLLTSYADGIIASVDDIEVS
jgi:phosphoglycolate phosphatase-like HAD superfamily hydrolase